MFLPFVVAVSDHVDFFYISRSSDVRSRRYSEYPCWSDERNHHWFERLVEYSQEAQAMNQGSS